MKGHDIQKEINALELIINHCNIVQTYVSYPTDNFDELQYDMYLDAISLRLATIGELTKRLSDKTKNNAKLINEYEQEIDWINLGGIRNVIDHDYDSVDHEIIIDTINEEIPQLKETCEALLKKYYRDYQNSNSIDEIK